MGVVDAASKAFMSGKEAFADVINLGIFHEKLVDPEKLEPANANVTLALYRDDEKRVEKSVERTLDDLRQTEIVMEDGQTTYVLIGTQYQLRIHYAMPIRHMVDAALLYATQVNAIAKDRRKEWAGERPKEKDGKTEETSAETAETKAGEKKKPKNSGEFLSGLTQGDKLKPVIVGVLYLGDKEWDGPLTLHDMLATTDERILRHCGNFPINLITPEMIAASGEHPESELWKSMYAIAAGHKKWKDLKELRDKKFFETMSNTAMRFINTVLGTNLPINESAKAGGQTNMCNAIREYYETLERSQSDNEKYQSEIRQYQSEITGYQSEITGYQSEIKEKNDVIAERDQEIAMLKAALKNAGISL